MVQERGFQFEQRYVLPLFLIAMFVVGVIAVGQWAYLQSINEDNETHAPTVDLAGQQRTLSQQIAKAATLGVQQFQEGQTNTYVSELATALIELETGLEALQSGDEAFNLTINNNTPQVDLLYRELEPHFTEIRSNVDCLVPLLQGISQPIGCSDDPNILLTNILENEDNFLEIMNSIVLEYEREINQELVDTQNVENLVVTLEVLALVAIAAFIIYPFTRRLQQSISNLEDAQQELNERRESAEAAQQQTVTLVNNLQTILDVNEQITSVLDPDRLLQDIVDIIKERFDLYHAHIYVYDQSKRLLVLTAGAGYVGREMVSENRIIEIGNQQSIVATAARSRRSVIIDDVRVSPTFLPHPLLPNTASEMAVALISRGELLGVLDVQNDTEAAFDENTANILEIMAKQIASAIYNARVFDVSDRTSRREQALSAITERIQGSTNMEEILQTAVIELGKALRVPHTALELKLPADNGTTEE